MQNLQSLADLAVQSGATGACVIDAQDIVVDDNLARLCRHPQCENYGVSAYCPPHTSGPAGFRKLLVEHQFAIFLKIEVPSETLISDRRQEVFQSLHRLAAAVEKSAIGMGCNKARSFAGGSCKSLFCNSHAICSVLDGGECRHPGEARPSMSGFGIDVSKLMSLCGWKLEWPGTHAEPETGTVCALVLV